MTEIQINASTSYCVRIGSSLIADIGKTISDLTEATTVCIVSDSNVWPLYGESIRCNLQNSGINTVQFVFPAGEGNKNIHVYSELLAFLAANQLTRTDCIIALGGGVVGDLAGFTAATYLRGIAYIQVPTTLLAMVDSSVGGKTGIDLPSGKNLCGAFYQPRAVLCDIDTMNTLPKDIFRDGCAEVIKYGILYDKKLFSHLEEAGENFHRESVIARCVELKRNAVEADEFDRGARKFLNLGHTIGHAVEQCSNYTVSHGQAVAIGMATVCKATDCQDMLRILSLLENFQLPTKTAFSAKDLTNAALSDKKRRGDTVDLIIPRTIADCYLLPISIHDLQAFIEKGH